MGQEVRGCLRQERENSVQTTLEFQGEEGEEEGVSKGRGTGTKEKGGAGLRWG